MRFWPECAARAARRGGPPTAAAEPGGRPERLRMTAFGGKIVYCYFPDYGRFLLKKKRENNHRQTMMNVLIKSLACFPYSTSQT